MAGFHPPRRRGIEQHCASLTVALLPGPGGQTSLREAACAANSNPGADTITFSVNGSFVLTRASTDEHANTNPEWW